MLTAPDLGDEQEQCGNVVDVQRGNPGQHGCRDGTGKGP